MTETPTIAVAPAAAPPPRGVTRPIPPELLRLALPVLASQLLRLAYQWVDALWVRALGVEATAAVTTSMFVMWTMYSLNDVFGIGVTAYVSQLLGAGDRRRAGLAAYKGLRATAMLGLLGTVAGVWAARPIFRLISHDPMVLDDGAAYLSVVLSFSSLPMIGLTAESIMRASGDTRTPLLIDACAVLLNAALDPLLIYGWGPFPRLGVAGAAWATVIAQAAMVAGYAVVAARRHRAFPFATRAPGPPIRLRGMIGVGVPAAFIGVMFSVVYVAFARAAGAYGAASLAVVGIANRIEALQFISSIAIGYAAASLVGQNLGAGRPDRAVQVIRTGVIWNLWLTGVTTVVFLWVPGMFVRLFTTDATTIALGTDYLRILALCFVLNGVEIVTAEAVMGSGHTRAISWIFTLFSLARIPLAFWAPQGTGLGVLAIAWVITVTCVIRGLLIVAWVLRGTWKRGLSRELHGADPPLVEPPGAA